MNMFWHVSKPLVAPIVHNLFSVNRHVPPSKSSQILMKSDVVCQPITTRGHVERSTHGPPGVSKRCQSGGQCWLLIIQRNSL